MNEKRIVGSGRTVGGKIQEAAGQVTCDAKTRVEGELNEASRAQDLNGLKTQRPALSALSKRAQKQSNAQLC